MRFIIDNNILFSLMKPDSTNSTLFSLFKIKFLAPDFIISEFKKYENECFNKSGLTRNSFNTRKNQVMSKIQFIQLS